MSYVYIAFEVVNYHTNDYGIGKKIEQYMKKNKYKEYNIISPIFSCQENDCVIVAFIP